jgi:hypothetical protein
MKRPTSLLGWVVVIGVLGVVLLSGPTHDAVAQERQWVSIYPGMPEGTPADIVLDQNASTPFESFFDVIIHGFWVTNKVGDDQRTYQFIEVPGLGSHNQTGAPDLPALKCRLATSADARVYKLTLVENVDVRTYSNYLVWPQPIPEVDHEEGDPEQFMIDSTIYYQYQGLWPAEEGRAESDMSIMLRSIPSAEVELSPVRWDPGERTLRVSAHTRYGFLHDGFRMNFQPMTKDRAARAAASIVNWPVVLVDFPVNFVFYDAEFLIIHPPGYSMALAPFVTQKQARGFIVTLKSTSETGTTCTAIRNAINNWEAGVPSWRDAYCLLVGDVDYIPLCTSPTGKPTDDLYASTNGDDLDEEVYLGRLSVDSENDCSNQIAKILSYEDSPNLFCCYDKVALWAHKQGAPGKYEGAHETVRTASYAVPPTFHTYYGSQAGVTDADVCARINNGVGVVAYRGHGSETSTGTSWNQPIEYFNSADVALLTNGMNQSPAVWSFASEIWMEQDSTGSVAYYGATRGSNTGQNNELDRQMFKAVYDLDLTTHSHAIEYAEEQMASLVASGNAWLYLLLGDPDMQVRRRNPGLVLANFPLEVEICSTIPCSLEVEVYDQSGQGIPGALVGLWKPLIPRAGGELGVAAILAGDDVFENRYTDTFGRTKIPCSPTSGGEMYIAIEDGRGNARLDTIVVYDPATGIEPPARIVSALHQNYPNPFNPTTTITYSIESAGWVVLTIHNVAGQRVRTLVNGMQFPKAGGYDVTWNGRNEAGEPVSSGVYFYSLVSQSFKQTRKMVLLK